MGGGYAKMAEKIFVHVTDTQTTTDEVIRQSVGSGADRLHLGRHGVQFHDQQPGYYLPEQIEENLTRIQGIQVAKTAIDSAIMSAPEADRESARRGISTILGHLSLSSLE